LCLGSLQVGLSATSQTCQTRPSAPATSISNVYDDSCLLECRSISIRLEGATSQKTGILSYRCICCFLALCNNAVKKKEVTVSWRNIQFIIESFIICTQISIIRVIRSERIKCMEHVTWTQR
jgi:hypothetical protein